MCKCEQKTDFKVALRKALAAASETEKMAVWENKKNKEIYFGTKKQAEGRLKNGSIECYFVPKIENKIIYFDIVEENSIDEGKGELTFVNNADEFSKNSGEIILQESKTFDKKNIKNQK